MDSQEDDGAPQSPRELIHRTERSWHAWVDAVEGIPEERLSEPMVGHWAAKDLLGHIAFWEDWVIGDCQRILAGEPNPGGDMDPVNQGQVADNTDASAADQKRYRDEAHARLMAFLATILDGEPKLPELVNALAGETYGHLYDTQNTDCDHALLI